jgi:hypothetical protein
LFWIFARLNFIPDMNKPTFPVLAVAFFLAIPNSGALADGTHIDNYATFISAGDYRNSQGERLTKVSEVIQQDRARVHKFGNPDGVSLHEEPGSGLYLVIRERQIKAE